MKTFVSRNTRGIGKELISGAPARRQEAGRSGGAPDGMSAEGGFCITPCVKLRMPWRRAATTVVAILLLIACAPSLLYAQTFAEQFNPSGDPVGGGPGYSAIPSPAAADYVLGARATAADLLALAKEYRHDDGTLVTPASAAAAGSLIWVDPAAVIDLNGYNRITFNDGVTLASNRGRDLGGGAYAPGALLKRRSMWPTTENGPQLHGLFMAWNGGRLTGFRARGPYDLRGVISTRTPSWLGGATFFVKSGVSGTFELDNNEVYGWPDFAVLWYHTTTGDVMHHNWVHHNRQVGWGYGLYPGRPFDAADEVTFLTEYNLFQENRHSIDGHSARPDSWHNLIWIVRGNVYLGKHGGAIIHAHNNKVGGCRYSGWKIDFIRNMIIQPGDGGKDFNHALPPPGGYLSVEDLYLDRTTRSRTYITRVSGDRIDPKDPNYDPNWLPGCDQPHGDVTSFDIHTSLNGATIPIEGSVPSATTLTEGQTLTLDLSGSSDPDGHAIVYHEVLWGDGKSVTDPAHREIAYGAQAQHTYTESGTYIVRVIAFNEYGIPSRATYHHLIVEPAAPGPLFVAFVGTDWPGVEGQNWPGYFSVRLLVNGHVVMSWRDVATFGGYERIEWNASPIDGDSTFALTMEIRTDQTISDPGGTEPGDVEFYVDRFYLFGRTGALYAEDLFFSDNNVSTMITTWGGGGSSSLFDHHDRVIGPGYGYALTVPNDGWVGHTAGDVFTFTTKAKGLDPMPETAPPVAPPPVASLLSWHPMEETGTTTTRRDAHATVDLQVVSSRPVDGAVPGLRGNAVDLGRRGRMVTKGSSPAFLLDLTQDFSVVSWVYVPAGETEAGVVWAVRNGGSNLELVTVPRRGRYQFTFYAGSAKKEYVRNENLVRDVWQMVTVRYDASAKTARLRVDETPDVEKVLSAAIDVGNGGDWWRIKGGGLRVDERSVWQRYLTDAEIAWLYNDGAGRAYGELIDEDQSLSVSDAVASDAVASHSLKLRQGWNQVPYLGEVPLPIDEVLSSVLEHVVLVKAAGAVYLPGFGINDIGMMQPRHGYKIYLSRPAKLVYASSDSSKTRSSRTLSPASGRPSEAPGVSSSAIVLVQGRGLQEGQRVSAWVPERGQVGEGVVQRNNAVALTIRGDESMTTDVIEGARTDERVVLRVHAEGQGEPQRLTVSSLIDVLSGQRIDGGSLLYHDDAFYVAHVEVLPQKFELSKNHPNPFNRSTTIEYSLPKKVKVELVIYDALGRCVATLVNEGQEAGIYRIEFGSAQLSSGVYFYYLRAGDFADSGKMTLVR